MFTQYGQVMCTVCGSSMKLAAIDYKSPSEMEIHCSCDRCREHRVVHVGPRECVDHQEQSAA